MKNAPAERPYNSDDDENFHTAFELLDPYGEVVFIDVGLAPLIQMLWRMRLKTVSCCQDIGESIMPSLPDRPHLAARVASDLGTAQIDFPIDSGLKFVNAVARGGPRDDFYDRMTHWVVPGAWEIKMPLLDRPALLGEPGPSEFAPIALLVRFPLSDVAEIMTRLAASDPGGEPRSEDAGGQLL